MALSRAGDDQGEVVGLLAGTVLLHGILDGGDEIPWMQTAASAHGFNQPGFAELAACGIIYGHGPASGIAHATLQKGKRSP